MGLNPTKAHLDVFLIQEIFHACDVEVFPF